MSDQGDLVDRLREESLQLARRSFDSVDAGISANLCDEAIDEIADLRSQLKSQQGIMAGWLIEKDEEIERLRAAKTAALKIADERAIEAVELRSQLEKAKSDLVFCREAMRHADIDLSMILPEASRDMQKAIRATLDRIDEARKRSLTDEQRGGS